MQNLKIFLTGGTGFFGKALLRYHLSVDQHLAPRIVVLSRNPGLFLAKNPEFKRYSSISFLKGDIQQRDTLPWGQDFTHVIHAATDSTIGTSLSPLQRYDQIVDGTRNVLDLAEASGARRFLLASSGAIYGIQPPELVTISEDWHGSPPLLDSSCAYGHGKRAAEHLCVLYGQKYNLETVVARCFAFVGRDLPLNAHFAIGNFIYDSLYSDIITVIGDGTHLRTYLDQEDLAYWLFTLLEEGKSGHAYNVGSDEVIRIASLAYLVRDILAPDKPVVFLSKPDSGAARNRYVPDISKARHDLGLKVTIPLSESIKSTGNVLLQSSSSDE